MPKLKDKSIRYRILMSLAQGEKRFTDLLSDIKRATLSKELQRLEEEKLVRRMVDNKSRPPKVTYSITSKGRDMLISVTPALIAEIQKKLELLLMMSSTLAITTKEQIPNIKSDPSAKAMVDGMIATALERAEKKVK